MAPATGFLPDAERATALDHRMRQRLVASLAYVARQAGEHLDLNAVRLERALQRISATPQDPLVVGAYYELVVAIELDELDRAQEFFDEILDRATDAAPPFCVLPLPDPATSRDGRRFEQLFNSDADAPFQIAPAPEALASAMATRVHEALTLLDQVSPELAAETRALVRTIVLAACPAPEDQEFVFDGASAFSLWGAILLNVESHESRPEMVSALVHETAHNLLFGLSTDGRLVLNAPDERYDSPLRPDDRPMDGIYHATFVSGRMALALEALANAEATALPAQDREQARALAAESRAAFARGDAVVHRHGRLSPLGEAILDSARSWLKKVVEIS